MLNSQGTSHFDKASIQNPAQSNQSCWNEQNLKYTVSFGKFEEQMPVHEELLELAAADKMKTQALEKACQMIALLEEQQEDLKKEITQLKQQLYNKKVKIEYLEQKIQAITHDHQPPGIQTSIKSSFPGSKIQALTGSKLFFSFSQSQKHSPEACTYTPPTFELDSDLLMSQELPLWQQPQGVIAGMKQAISRQQSSEDALRQIETLVEGQEMESEMLKWQLEEKIEHIQEFMEYDFSFSSREQAKSSSTQTQRQTESIPSKILQQYQNIIFDYKAYTNRLKAYLCEAINYIADLADSFRNALPSQTTNVSPISYFISTLLLKYRDRKIQNRQLRLIIEGLIYNLKYLSNQNYTIE